MIFKFLVIVLTSYILLPGCKTQDKETTAFLQSLQYDSTIALKSEKTLLNDNIEVRDIDTDSTKTLSHVYKEDNTLFFYFTFSHCDDCIKRVFGYFAANPAYNHGKMVFIAGTEDVRALYILKQMNSLKFPVYTIRNIDSLKAAAFHYSKPVFFMVKMGKMYNIHFVNFNLPQRTNYYLKKNDN